MLSGFLIGFREALEVALVVGIVVGFLSRTGQSRHKRTVYLALGVGVVVSLLGAVAFKFLAGGFEGRSEEIFEGVTMLIGAALLTTMIFWVMKQGNIAATLRARVADEMDRSRGRGVGLFLLVFVSVLREGIETVIFLGAAAFTGGYSTLLGGLLGMTAAIALGYGLFTASLRIDLKNFFRATNALLILFAAGLVAHGIHELQEARLLPTFVANVWNLNPAPHADGSLPWLHEKGVVGQTLSALFGYNGNPSLLEVLGYLAYVAGAAGLWIRFARKPAPTVAPAPVSANVARASAPRAGEPAA